MKLDFTQRPVQIGSGAILALVVFIVAFAMRGAGEAGSLGASATPYTARLVAGSGTKRHTPQVNEFVAVVIPTDLSERDLLTFGDTNENIVALPDKASLRFTAQSSISLESMKKSGSRHELHGELAGHGRVFVKGAPEHVIKITAKHAAVRSMPGATFEVIQEQDKDFYEVTTVKVFDGAVEFSGRTKSSDKVVVNAGQTARINDDKLFPPESLGDKRDDWETWNLSFVEFGGAAAANTASSQINRPAVTVPAAVPTTAQEPPSQPQPPPASPPPPPSSQQGPPPQSAPDPGQRPPAAQQPPAVQPPPRQSAPSLQQPPPIPAQPPAPAAPPTIAPAATPPKLPDPVYAPGNAPTPGNTPQPPPGGAPPPGGPPPPPGGGAPGPGGGSSGPGEAPVVDPSAKPPGY